MIKHLLPAVLLCVGCGPEPIPCLRADDLRDWTMDGAAELIQDACGHASSARLDLRAGAVTMSRSYALPQSATVNLIAKIAQPCPGARVSLSIGETQRDDIDFPAVLRVPVQATAPTTIAARWTGNGCATLYASLLSYTD